MLFLLLHGHPIEALRYNALSLLLLPVVLYCLLRKSFELRLPVLPRVPSGWFAALTLAVILFAVARNIPAEPFCKLAPGGVCPASTLKTLSSPLSLHEARNSYITGVLVAQTFRTNDARTLLAFEWQ